MKIFEKGEDINPDQEAISSTRYTQNYAQNPKGEDGEGSEDIFRTSNGDPPSSSHVYLYTCYHPGCDFHTDIQLDYERHGALKHLKNPLLYPSKAEIEKYGLKPPGKEWKV